MQPRARRPILLSLMLSACSASPASQAPRRATPASVTPAEVEIVEEAVTFAGAGHEIPGTLTRPRGDGPWPALVLLAGSGPTDRAWNSPLLPGKNGSGALLARALAREGVVVVGFDKAGAGANQVQAAAITFDTYRDEALAALAYVRARPEVRADAVFIAGHSEGALHAIRAAHEATDQLAGLILLASPGQPLADKLVAQVEGNLRGAKMAPAEIERAMVPFRAAISSFLAGKPVDAAKASSIPALQQLVAGLTTESTAPVVRSLLALDPSKAIAGVATNVLVVGGGKDVQMDPLDADALVEARRRADRPVARYTSPDADHVLKLEARPLAELRANLAAVQAAYNGEERRLADDLVREVRRWMSSLER
jgi:pimeloyl-ACP methyl ester carboxylesterase